MKFYLGTHMPSWLRRVEVRLFVSHRRLNQYRRLPRAITPRAITPWALDSGGFTELSLFGGWRTSPFAYASAVRRYRDEIGRLEWASPQDWMCEPFMLERTGLSIEDHQQLTTANFLELRTMAADLPFIPVLQGWQPDDYLRHVEMYESAGVDLAVEPLVGLGSVCRRQASGEAEDIVLRLQPLRLHGFGIKTQAIARYGGILTSSDSMAWSYAGRRRPSANCSRATCANCEHYALAWRDRLLNQPMSLFGLAA